YSIQTDDKVFKNLWAKYNSDCRWKAVQEIEAIVNVISNYALSDAQSDSINNVSLAPFYRKMAIHISNAKTFKVMNLDRPETGATLKDWPRNSRHVVDLSPEGKIALERLQEQIRIRLPDVSSEQEEAFDGEIMAGEESRE
ncbi:hypothetical protein ACHAXS_003939, partial [Conticribra weissflogii]